MKSFLTILLFLLLTSNSFSQNGWVQVNSGTTKPFSKSFFINVNTGWVCGDSGLVIKTTNKGFTWSTCNTGTTQLLKDIFFINEITGWAAGGRFEGIGLPANRMFIIKTTNGGASWFNQLDFSDWYNVLTCIYFFDANTGISFGAGGNGGASTGAMHKTTNGGSTWTYTPARSTTALKADNSGNLWNLALTWVDVGGMDSSFVNFSSDRGQTWQLKLRMHHRSFGDLDLLNNSTPVILSDSSTQILYYKSTNSGSSWTNTILPLTGYQNYIEFVNENTGWCGRSQLYYTTNAGINWSTQLNPSPNFILKTQMFDSLNGICLASSGKIYITGTGGIVGVHQNANTLPDNFSLSQNYPNPFNPSTRINYELPITNYVSLKVYDALGNEVETLVNEKQNAGSYSVDFNAAELPSGIYFYKLVTEKFSETRKMVLVK